MGLLKTFFMKNGTFGALNIQKEKIDDGKGGDYCQHDFLIGESWSTAGGVREGGFLSKAKKLKVIGWQKITNL